GAARAQADRVAAAGRRPSGGGGGARLAPSSYVGDSAPAIHDTGVGPAILFLRGFPLDASQWDHQVAALGGDHRCLRPDMWGCGSSPPPPAGEPSLDAYAEQLLRTLDARGVETFCCVGLAMGGSIGFSYICFV